VPNISSYVLRVSEGMHIVQFPQVSLVTWDTVDTHDGLLSFWFLFWLIKTYEGRLSFFVKEIMQLKVFFQNLSFLDLNIISQADCFFRIVVRTIFGFTVLNNLFSLFLLKKYIFSQRLMSLRLK
jgi:hypothetical protein